MDTAMVKRIPGHSFLFDVGHAIIVDYDASIKALLKEGNYTQVHPEITAKNFPTKKKGKEEIVVKVIKLSQRPLFGDRGFEEEMIAIRNNGYEVVNLQELLTALCYIEYRPSILALGSKIDVGDSLMSPFVRKGGNMGNVVGLEEV
ncbi:MAG: hypothetical protein WC938_01605 [Candidatus Paceibacterota bacterium]|jgi:hypothetical protein